jgi:hypothetical protein
MIRGIKTITVDPAILKEVTDILLNEFQTEIAIKSVIILSEPSRRNLVLRIILQNSSEGIPESIILNLLKMIKKCLVGLPEIGLVLNF